jgi:hypothetical protein
MFITFADFSSYVAFTFLIWFLPKQYSSGLGDKTKTCGVWREWNRNCRGCDSKLERARKAAPRPLSWLASPAQYCSIVLRRASPWSERLKFLFLRAFGQTIQGSLRLRGHWKRKRSEFVSFLNKQYGEWLARNWCQSVLGTKEWVVSKLALAPLLFAPSLSRRCMMMCLYENKRTDGRRRMCAVSPNPLTWMS